MASSSPLNPEWSNSVLLKANVVKEVEKLKTEEGPGLRVVGSGNFAQTLFKNDLVDELLLIMFPLTPGPGKRLFADGVVPAAWKMTEAKISTNGVIVAFYRV